MEISKHKIAKCFTQSLSSYSAEAKAQNQINQRLIEILKQHSDGSFEQILEIGAGAGNLSELLYQTCNVSKWIFNDLSPLALATLKQRYGTSHQYLCADAENLDEPMLVGSCDLIVAGSVVQWFENPQHFIEMASRSLTYEGLLLFNTFLPENLYEIKQLTGIGLTYPTAEKWREWLANDFTIIEWEMPTIRLLFKDPKEALKHLKSTGVTATQTKGWTKRTLEQFIQAYWQKFSANQHVSLTYTPLLILARRK